MSFQASQKARVSRSAPSDRVRQVLDGNVRVASRLITAAQDGSTEARQLLSELYPYCERAKLIGVTGPPGAGKSTLVGALIADLRRRNLTVGVLAVDPSSPFSGGAVLGDRDRMMGFAGDSGVFIRSLASRGATGGLCTVANDAVDVLDAMGRDVVLIETVGVGQSEVEIARIASTVILTLVPGYGDSLQAMKAGIMEIADILVVNKADDPRADAAVNELNSMDYRRAVPGEDEPWQVPVLKTIARSGEGVVALVDAVLEHIEFAGRTDWKTARQRARRRRQFIDMLTSKLRNELVDSMDRDPRVIELVRQVECMEVDPHTAAHRLSGEFRAAFNQAERLHHE